jgi:small-conductance mechanosensitive channel
MVDRWVWAAIVIVAGLATGTSLGWFVRNRLQRSRHRPAVRRIANASGAFLFWFFTVLGVVFAVGLVSPETLEPLPRQILDYLPRVFAAGLIVIGGWALAIIASNLLAAGLSQATGRPEREFELVIRVTVLTLAGVLALAQLGVNVTIITVLVAAIALTVGASVTILLGHAGRQISGDIAAGRYLRTFVDLGDHVAAAEFEGRVVGIHPATLELEAPDGSRVHAPFSRVLEIGPTIRPSS